MTGIASLRKFVKPRDGAERCDACGAPLPGGHTHQFEPYTRQVRCACDRCLRISGSWLEIPTAIRALNDFRITDAQWDDLMIPISLAFFTFSTPVGRLMAFYPGPAGATESAMHLDAWREIGDSLQPDVEALLVNRVGSAREYFVVPIDECYRLVGLIRIHWRGLSGGTLVWGEIARFFDNLRAKGSLCLS